MKPHYHMSVSLRALLLFISCLLMTHTDRYAQAKKKEQRYSARMIIMPIRVPHLDTSQIDQQTLKLIKSSQRLKGISTVSLSKVKRGLRRQNFNLKLLDRPLSAVSEVRRLCIRLSADYAVGIRMKLGTDHKPARLIGALYFCRNRHGRIERFELPFEGKLTSRIWNLLTDTLEEELSRPPTRRSIDPSSVPISTYHSAPRPLSEATQALIPQPPPSMVMTAPTPSVKREVIPLSMEAPQPPPKMIAPENMMIESSRFSIWGGARLLTKSFIYKTKPNSRVLEGGLSYDTQWLMGWGGQFQFRPFETIGQTLRGLMFTGSFERYTYDSIRIIRSPFGSSTQIKLMSDLNRWSGGLRYGYPLRTLQQTHQVGFSAAYHGTLMNLAPNLEYLGLDTHLIDLGVFGEFVLSPGKFYLSLAGGFRPVASFGNRVTELGSTAESYGASSAIGFHYRSFDGLSLGLKINLSLLFSEPSGEGRGGRIGESARDQTLSFDLNIGFKSNSIHK